MLNFQSMDELYTNLSGTFFFFKNINFGIKVKIEVVVGFALKNCLHAMHKATYSGTLNSQKSLEKCFNRFDI